MSSFDVLNIKEKKLGSIKFKWSQASISRVHIELISKHISYLRNAFKII